jgi:hypothetical protein
MGFILTDLTDDAHCLNINAWNWRPIIGLIQSSGILTEETLEWMGYNAGAQITAEEAGKIAAYLRENHLPFLKMGDRIKLDGTVTDSPDTYEFYREKLEKNYSVTFDSLTGFVNFCASCKGFSVY